MKGHDTKERLLKIGLDQMSVHGLGGLTLGQLASASGLSKSGLFAHFKSKEMLQIALLDEMKQLADRIVVTPAMDVADGLPQLVVLMDHWLGWSRRAGLTGGCPVAAAMFELDDMEGEVRAHASKMETQWRALLRQILLRAKELEQLSGETDVEQIIWELCGIYLSHHVASRFQRHDDADIRAETAFMALLDRYRPAGSPREQNRSDRPAT